MDQWSARDDRPYFREGRSAYVWWIFFLVLVLAAGATAYYFGSQRELLGLPPLASTQPRSEVPPPAEPKSEPPQRSEAGPAESAKALPSLENSDALMRETVSGL